MKIIFLSAQHPERVSQSSILRAYSELKNEFIDVKFVCIADDIYHRLKGKDRALIRKEKKGITNLSFWLFPGVIPVFDTLLTNLWGNSYAKNLDYSKFKGEIIHFIVEAGAASVVAWKIWNRLQSSDLDFSMHYRINDPLDAFRSTPGSIEKAHFNLVDISKSDSRLICSAPALLKGVKHIPPGLPKKIYNHKRTGRSTTPYIFYSGVYPIEASMIETLIKSYPEIKIKYTGLKDHKINGSENLGLIPANEVDKLWLDAWAGVMVFPDDRFTWWLWSNKMIVMKFLKIPIFGFLKNETKDVFKSHGTKRSLFVEHGLVELGEEKKPSFIDNDKTYDWKSFSRQLLRPVI